MVDKSRRRLCVVFVHPDLGIGGAERLVVDAGLALSRRGHSVHYVTAHHDPDHCFPETRRQLPVTVCGDWLPVAVLGRLRALCAYVRMLYVSLYLLLFSGLRPDVVVCDQVSACVPVLRCGRARVLFYCHFPDQLLSGARHSTLKRLYRRPLDWLEETTTGMAHRVLVNSRFTADVFANTFRSLRHLTPDVLYPAVDLSAFDDTAAISDAALAEALSCPLPERFVLSLNRFERKKNIGLAVDAFAELLRREDSAATLSGCRLVLAGGYDPLNEENVLHFAELERRCAEPALKGRVSLLKSPCDLLKRQLLSRSVTVLYTPDGEHFGIVPLEAMYCGRPVVAVDSGGPRETVLHERTGLLCRPESSAFAAALLSLLRDPALADRMGRAGRERVQQHFSFEAFADKLESVVLELTDHTDTKSH